MLDYRIKISIDDDFGVDPNYTNTIVLGSQRKVKGIESLSGSTAVVDPSILMPKNFWKPVERLLKYEKKINDLGKEEFFSLFSDLGKCEREDDEIIFDTDNDYDLSKISHSIDRMSFIYRNCPVYSLYLIQLDEMVDIIIGPYTKDYFVISEWQWVQFVEHLSKDVKENRNMKLNEILGEREESYTNIIRQLKFLGNTGKADSFQSSVLDFYEKRGYITEKQANAIKKNL